jgi:hypothetical protein
VGILESISSIEPLRGSEDTTSRAMDSDSDGEVLQDSPGVVGTPDGEYSSTASQSSSSSLDEESDVDEPSRLFSNVYDALTCVIHPGPNPPGTVSIRFRFGGFNGEQRVRNRAGLKRRPPSLG